MPSLKAFPSLAVLVIRMLQAATASPLYTRSGPTCTNITISVSINATNFALPTNLGIYELLTQVNGLVSSALTIPVHGPFDIAATFCEPEVYSASRANTLQFLNHGATYSRSYWFGDYLDQQYSWVDFASKAGYPSLSIDRLGCGLSSHPDPILTVQYPAEVEVAHTIISLARSGSLPLPATRSFASIIYVGHSYGSIIGNNLNVHHPEDCNAMILTGFSSTVVTSLGGVLLQSGALPAAVVDPAKYAGLDVGYLEFSSISGFRNLFYGPQGTFDINVLNADFRGRGTVTAGEAVTAVIATSQAAAFTGQVYVMTGQHDAIFCNPTGLNLDLLGAGPQCMGGSANYLEMTRSLYPSSSSFSWQVLPNSGHCWQLHYEAYAAFGNAHQWLTAHGY